MHSNLLQRVFSALAVLGVVFAAYWWSERTGILYVSLAFILFGTWEASQFFAILQKACLSPAKPEERRNWLQILFLVFAVAIILANLLSAWPMPSLAVLPFGLGVLLIIQRKQPAESTYNALNSLLGGWVYFAVFPSLTLSLLHSDQGFKWFVFLLAVTFSGDTFAYFGGRLFGRTKLIAAVSPNKSVEGAIIGLIASSVVGLTILQLIQPDLSIGLAWLIALTTGFLSQSGDLVVSLWKRQLQIKDSGWLMPGHGGILDRLDGVYNAAPLVYLCFLMLPGKPF